MPVHNRDIAEQFSRLADLLEVEGANPFRVRAYRNAARTVGSHSLAMAEMRENRGEIEAASEGRLPVLVALDDIRGDLHCHTSATDGHHGLELLRRN